jgi:hypothetical protein
MATAAYVDKEQYNRERNRQQSLVGRDIAPLPAVANPERREKCRLDFRLFRQTYFPATNSITPGCHVLSNHGSRP